MIVLFEGVDGGGKTTTLARLKETFPESKELEWPGRKARTTKEFLEASKKFIEEHKDKVNDGNLYFVDRCGLGEFMYGPLMGRDMATTEEYKEVFKDWLKDKLIIICVNPKAHERAVKRGEDGPAKEAGFHKMVTEGYKNLCNGTGLHIIGYNWEVEGQYEALVGAILAHRVVEVMK